MKKKVLLSSIATIALCLCLIAGSTFALFTSKTDVNIAVTAGEVDVFASLTNLKLYSVTPDDDGVIADENGKFYSYEEQSGKFLNEGTAVINGGTLTLDRVTPGDKVSFNVAVDNNSDVAIAHRFIVSCTDGYSLMYGLNVTINGTTYEHLDTYVSDWENLVAEGSIDDIEIVIELPVTAGNEYQKLSTAINVTVEAVQGNANLDAAPAATYIEKVADATALQHVMAAGGSVAGLGAVIENEGLGLDGNDVTLASMTLNQTTSPEGYSIGYGSGEPLTLEDNVTVNAAGQFAVAIIGNGNLVVDETCRINAGSYAAIYVYGWGEDDVINIHLNGSGLLDGSTRGISVATGIGYTVNIYVEDDAALTEYHAMLDKEYGGTQPTVNWYVNGVLTVTD